MEKISYKLTSERLLSQSKQKQLLREMEREKDASIITGKKSGFIIDYYLIAIALSTGLRVSELSTLEWSDIQESSLIIRRGKGSKMREVVFGNKTVELFKSLRNLSQPPHKSNRLFIGQRGPLTRFGIHQRFAYWRQRLSLSQASGIHQLRHSYATNLLNAGIDLAALKEQLGHANISTTSVYLHLSDSARDKIKALL